MTFIRWGKEAGALLAHPLHRSATALLLDKYEGGNFKVISQMIRIITDRWIVYLTQAVSLPPTCIHYNKQPSNTKLFF